MLQCGKIFVGKGCPASDARTPPRPAGSGVAAPDPGFRRDDGILFTLGPIDIQP